MRFARSAILAGLVIVLAAPSLRAQASVTGTITDAMTGRPLSDAQVFFGSPPCPP
jgi:hypothetical protein